jgi:hypothetical protein
MGAESDEALWATVVDVAGRLASSRRYARSASLLTGGRVEVTDGRQPSKPLKAPPPALRAAAAAEFDALKASVDLSPAMRERWARLSPSTDHGTAVLLGKRRRGVPSVKADLWFWHCRPGVAYATAASVTSDAAVIGGFALRAEVVAELLHETLEAVVVDLVGVTAAQRHRLYPHLTIMNAPNVHAESLPTVEWVEALSGVAELRVAVPYLL